MGGDGDALESEVNVISWAQEWEPIWMTFRNATGTKINNTFQTDPLQTATMIRASPAPSMWSPMDPSIRPR